MGAGDTVYRVVLDLSTTGSLGERLQHMEGNANKLHDKLEHTREAAEKMTERVAGAAERAGEGLQRMADRAWEVSKHIAEIGIGGGIALATYGVGHLNRELEETSISLATVFQTQGFTNDFTVAMKQSADQVAKMKQDVKTLPGDLGQLSNIMKMIATPAAQGGATQDKIREMAGRGMLVGRILGVDQDMMARELAQLFAGRAGSHNILGGRLGLVGEEAKKFNAESAQQRVAQIEKMFNSPAMNAAAGAFASTWVAQSTTLVDNVKYLMLAPATGGLFERIKGSIAEANEYIEVHKHQIEAVASLVNRRLVAAWDWLEATFKRIEPIVARIADKFISMQPAQLGQHLAHAGEAMLGMKFGGMAMSGAGSMLGMVGSMGGSAGIGGGMAALGAALPTIAVALPPLIIGAGIVAGAFDVLTDKTSIYHDEAVKLSDEIGSNLTTTMQQLSPVVSRLGEETRILGDEAGIYLLESLERASSWVVRFGSAVDHMSGLIAHGWSVAMHGAAGAAALDTFNASVDTPGPIKEKVLDLLLGQGAFARENGAGTFKKAGAKEGGGGGGGGTHIQKVEIIVAGNNDPSRVARLTVEALNKIAKNPTSSSFVPNFERAKH